MHLDTTLDWLLSHNTKPVTAEELDNVSWVGSIDHADSGLKRKYEQLADAINAITRVYL